MIDVTRLIVSILLLPFVIVGTFVVFWAVVVLTFLEAFVALPLTWLASADGKFSDNTFPLEEHLADLEPHLTLMKMQKAKIHATPEAEVFPDAAKADVGG